MYNGEHKWDFQLGSCGVRVKCWGGTSSLGKMPPHIDQHVQLNLKCLFCWTLPHAANSNSPAETMGLFRDLISGVLAYYYALKPLQFWNRWGVKHAQWDSVLFFPYVFNYLAEKYLRAANHGACGVSPHLAFTGAESREQGGKKDYCVCWPVLTLTTRALWDQEQAMSTTQNDCSDECA